MSRPLLDCQLQRSAEQRRAKRSPIRAMGAAVDHGLLRFFGAVAAFVARYPVPVLVAMTVLGLLLSAGICRVRVLTNPEDLYTPQNNVAFQNRVRYSPRRLDVAKPEPRKRGIRENSQAGDVHEHGNVEAKIFSCPGCCPFHDAAIARAPRADPCEAVFLAGRSPL